MCQEVIYEGHEFHNQTLRKDLKILRNSAVAKYLRNAKVFCSLGNQVHKCASKSWEYFTSMKQFNLHCEVTSPSGVLPVLWKKTSSYSVLSSTLYISTE